MCCSLDFENSLHIWLLKQYSILMYITIEYRTFVQCIFCYVGYIIELRTMVVVMLVLELAVSR